MVVVFSDGCQGCPVVRSPKSFYAEPSETQVAGTQCEEYLPETNIRKTIAETNTFPDGLQLKTHSVDAGTRLALPNALGNPLRAWDNRQNVRRWT